MDNDLTDMYGNTDDDINQKPVEKAQSIKIKTTGLLTEMQIGNEKVFLVDPKEYTKIALAVNDLQKRLSLTEARIRMLQGDVLRKDQQIRQLKSELQGKIGYDDR